MLHDYQQEFSKAILENQIPTSDKVWLQETTYPSSLGMAVYRNNYVAGLSEVLSDIYPVVKQIVGNGFFAYMSHEYIRANPPASPILSLYGETYPDFIDGFTPADTVPYLGDTARLEQFRHQALQAPDACPLEPVRLTEVSEDRIPSIVFTLHPSCRMLQSTFDINAIWRAHKENEEGAEGISDHDPGARGAHILIARSHAAVDMLELDKNTFDFLSALADGETLGTASDIPNPDWNIMEVLTELLVFGTFTNFDCTE